MPTMEKISDSEVKITEQVTQERIICLDTLFAELENINIDISRDEQKLVDDGLRKTDKLAEIQSLRNLGCKTKQEIAMEEAQAQA